MEVVFSVSLSESDDPQFIWFSCSSSFTVSSIPGGSDVVSGFDCTWFICL